MSTIILKTASKQRIKVKYGALPLRLHSWYNTAAEGLEKQSLLTVIEPQS